jgi:hypothetical protein
MCLRKLQEKGENFVMINLIIYVLWQAVSHLLGEITMNTRFLVEELGRRDPWGGLGVYFGSNINNDL